MVVITTDRGDMIFKTFREWQKSRSRLLRETQAPVPDPSVLINQIQKHEAMLQEVLKRRETAVADYKVNLGAKIRQVLAQGDAEAADVGLDDDSPYMGWSSEVHELLDREGFDRLEQEEY